MSELRRLGERGRTQTQRSGFSLVEVLVALTLVAMSILFVSRAFLTLLAITNVSGNKTVAAALAVRKLEEIRARPEGQTEYSGWSQEFDNAVVNEARQSFQAPFTNYQWETSIDQVVFSPAQPGWITDPNLHPDNMKFITVRVYFLSETDPLAAVSSAVVRGMYIGP